TFFSLPEFPLKVNALILLWTVDLFSNLDLEINFKLSERFAYFLSFAMSLLLYFLGMLRLKN
ncbi:MAG: hypothetical protein NZ526_07275, partial [Aquificaceae bacterium]|nr:hypothetical protein [Aquificaceae bacterium]